MLMLDTNQTNILLDGSTPAAMAVDALKFIVHVSQTDTILVSLLNLLFLVHRRHPPTTPRREPR